MQTLPHGLDRTVVIQAAPETVFRYFTDSDRWAAWWGAGSSIDARPGGRMVIRHPNGVEASGEVVAVDRPSRIVFTYGYASGTPVAPGASRVTITLEPSGLGTRLRLVHDFADPVARDEHVQGWRFQLSLFANIVADEVFAGGAQLVDAWFDAWRIVDDGERERTLARIVSPGIRFRDRYSLLKGLEDLTAHTGAAQRFMPGISMQRIGTVRHCQGTLLADWIASGADGAERMRGTNVFLLAPDGRMESVIGLAPAP